MNPKLAIVLLLLGCALHRAKTQTTTASEPTPAENSSSESTSTATPEESTTPEVTTPAPPFSCPTHTGTPVDLKAISGTWYETARAPNVDATQCLRYSLPQTATSDNKLNINVEYVNTADNKWDHEDESMQLPWDDNGKNGIFTWNLGGVTQLTITLKLVATDNEKYALYCGYMPGDISMFYKVLTRKRELSDADKTTVQQKFQEYSTGTELSWVEQSEQKCNSAVRSAGGILVALALALLVRQRNF